MTLQVDDPLFKQNAQYDDEGNQLVGDRNYAHIFAAKTVTGTPTFAWSSMYDGDPTTYLQIDSTSETTIKFDLGSVKTVKTCEVYFGMTADVSSDRYLQYSKDGTTWTTVFSVLGQTNPTTKYTKNFSNVKARYVRIRATGSNNLILYVYDVSIVT